VWVTGKVSHRSRVLLGKNQWTSFAIKVVISAEHFIYIRRSLFGKIFLTLQILLNKQLFRFHTRGVLAARHTSKSCTSITAHASSQTTFLCPVTRKLLFFPSFTGTSLQSTVLNRAASALGFMIFSPSFFHCFFSSLYRHPYPHIFWNIFITFMPVILLHHDHKEEIFFACTFYSPICSFVNMPRSCTQKVHVVLWLYRHKWHFITCYTVQRAVTNIHVLN